MATHAPHKAVLRHLAIVMDGNGRWAKKRHKPRSFGHSAGQKAVRKTVEFCLQKGIESLTLFAFSSENWQRPQSEVNTLLNLFLKAINKETAELDKQGVKINFIGDLNKFDPELESRMQTSMQTTAQNQALKLNIAVNYGGHWDIVQAAQTLCRQAINGRLAIDDINEEVFSRAVCLADQPMPDLLIRTGGNYRISNFLLWQLAYTELFFTQTLWPDVDADCLASAIDDFTSRQRRFGKLADPDPKQKD